MPSAEKQVAKICRIRIALAVLGLESSERINKDGCKRVCNGLVCFYKGGWEGVCTPRCHTPSDSSIVI